MREKFMSIRLTEREYTHPQKNLIFPLVISLKSDQSLLRVGIDQCDLYHQQSFLKGSRHVRGSERDEFKNAF